MVERRRHWDDRLCVPGHSKEFTEPLRFCDDLPLGNPGDACQVYKAEATRSNQNYAVKMYKPYSKEQMARDRSRLRRKGYNVSDDALENYFHPWHRESRAYEQIDRHIPQPGRQFFLKYYGTALIPFSSVPAHWTRTMPYGEQVPVVVLEFFEGSWSSNDTFDLQISPESMAKAKEIYSQLGDGPMHVYIHLMEVLETLHAANIIHGDLKSDAFAGYASAGRLLMFDFSLSWVSNHLPCLDPFHRSPMTFTQQSRRERKDIEDIIATEYSALQNKIPSLNDCRNCIGAVERICERLHPSRETGV